MQEHGLSYSHVANEKWALQYELYFYILSLIVFSILFFKKSKLKVLLLFLVFNFVILIGTVITTNKLMVLECKKSLADQNCKKINNSYIECNYVHQNKEVVSTIGGCNNSLDNIRYKNNVFEPLTKLKSNIELSTTRFGRCLDFSPEDCFNMGINSIEADQIADGISYLKEACANKYWRSCATLADTLFRTNQLIESKKYAFSACENNNAIACQIMGDIATAEKNNVAAMKYFEMACANDSAESCNELGYRLNQNKDKDINKIIQYFEKACALDFLRGCNNLAASFNELGKSKEAIDLFIKTCERNESNGCAGASYLFKRDNQLAKAISYAQKSCDLKNSGGCFNLALYSSKQKNGRIEFDLSKKDYLKKILELACRGEQYKNNIADGCLFLGIIAAASGEHSKARDEFLPLCDNYKNQYNTDTQKEACFQLGKYFFNAENYNSAKEKMKMACSKEHKEACYWIGLIDEKQGHSKESKESFQTACDSGIIEACRKIKKL